MRSLQTSPPRHLVIRADASRAIGGGHVQRCLSLAETLRSRGWSCALLTGPETAATVPLPSWLDLPREAPPADLLIVDHYGLDRVWESSARLWARRIMAIDDLADREHDCDLLLDQAAGRCEEDYRALIPDHCRMLLGPAYAILRPAFADLRAGGLARRATPGRRILINAGAVDTANVAGRILAGLAASGKPFDADVVCGASAEHIPALQALARGLPGSITIHGRVAAMAELMVEADLAVGAAGSASWERCALGLPSIVLTLADNQRQNAHMLTETGAGLPATLAEAADKALALLDDKPALAAMSERASALCDGMGASRVADAIEEIITTEAPHG